MLTSLLTCAQENNEHVDNKTLMLSFFLEPDLKNSLCLSEIDRTKK